jgi:cyclic pyranopterin phosphate synthase
MAEFSHLDANNQPTMVDISAKAVSVRTALAEARVFLPPTVRAALNADGELQSPKGPVFQTAIIAGTMAVKKTAELIPFCHPLPIDHCRIELHLASENELVITCRVRVTHSTGVEMEALTGATVAALTVYDMCKALSHALEIRTVRLLTKTGGKSDYHSDQP